MHYALEFCKPLFRSDLYYNGRWSAHGAVKITDYDKIKLRIETKLKKEFPQPAYDLQITWMKKPEAMII